jgi:lipopolysaccharide transport system permease protein
MTAVIGALREAAGRHELLWTLAARQVRARYKQTVLGAGWAVLQPLMLMAICAFVFGRVARVPSDGLPYPLFAYSGLVFWTYTAVAVSVGTTIVVANADLVRKIYFPRELLPLSVVIAGTVDLAVAVGVLGVLMAWYGVVPTAAAVAVVPVFALHVVFLTGVVLVTSALHVRARDVGHAVPVAVQIWMLASPVAYPASLVPEGARALYVLNPMAPLLEGYRAALLHARAPDWATLGMAAQVSVAVLGAGYLLFKRMEADFADVV